MIHKDLLSVGVNLTRYDGDYGIEIETECNRSYEYPTFKFWDATTDGSLRMNGVEYILKQPVSYGKELEDALEEFNLKTSKLDFIESPYTSVHVHSNFLNETWNTLANFIVTYIIFENVLTRFSGPERESNLFCLSIKDAEGCLTSIMHVLQYVEKCLYNRIRLDDNASKYSALNMASLHRLGTLEIRTYRGTHNTQEIYRWISIIHKIREFAKGDLTPVTIAEMAISDPAEFFNTVFGELESSFPYSDRVDLVSRNLYYAAKVASCVKDWKDFGVKKKKKSNNFETKLQELSLAQFGTPYAELSPLQRFIVDEQFSETIESRTSPRGEVLVNWTTTRIEGEF